jgi:hypothetical protein
MTSPTFVTISEQEKALCFKQLKRVDWFEEQPYSGRNRPVCLEKYIKELQL